ncbi:CheY-like chemotaxis protein [Rubricella aquisinus]|uniref:CheY-like chemotaxis protein n=1 Tax=Rubricella aquisinus TaxID=2028108 RepID=A0A840WPG2_9RHOB|nr:response regulator [Rubricella aquisinus]MBB5515963.1 CheY-like chemotaxis protein [Rubricella aquisinus]
MAQPSPEIDLHALAVQELPYLRRYARALTGSQTLGDGLATATLARLVDEPSQLRADLSGRAALFAIFQKVWAGEGVHGDQPAPTEDGTLAARAFDRLSALTPKTREAMLLSRMEGFRIEDIAAILGVSRDEADQLLTIGLNDMADGMRGRVMIIEDEPIIAMDLRSIVTTLGHSVVGVARTRDAAIALQKREAPDLILADIQLADGSSGIDAINDILSRESETPVIFITAYPERLLTGERPEPAFLITKPFSEEQVRSSVSQAMFFASTESLLNQG